MRPLVIVIACALISGIDAASPEIQLPGGVSPRLRRELVLVPLPETPAQEATFRAVVRDIRAKADIASDMVIGYGRLEAEPYMRASWNPDGSYVAFNIQWTRHTRQTLVYQVAGSRMTLIQLPDYWPKAERVLQRPADFVGGTETPLRWLDEHTLLVRSVGALRDETEFDILVAVTFAGETASVRSVTLHKEDVTRR